MKIKLPLLTLAAAAMFSACTSSDIVDDKIKTELNRIGFNTTVSKGSRAMTNDNFTKFFVFGSYTLPTQSTPITVFSHDLVSKGSDGTWTYSDGDRYWMPNGSYDFYAYSCENNDMDPNISGTWAFENRVLTLSEVHSNANHQHDLLFAKSTNQSRAENTTTANPVALKFSHILTRVRFTFSSVFPSSYKVYISNVRIINFRDMGTFDGDNEEWGDVKRSSTNLTMTLKLPSTSTDITSTTASTEAAYFIPYTYSAADVRLAFDIDVKRDDVSVLGRTITATWQPSWLAGHSINNAITINGSNTGVAKISFTATIGGDDSADDDGWDSDTGALNNLHFDVSTSD